MNNLIDFKNFLTEGISASEAYTDRDSIKTLVDGKRELAYLAISTQQLLDPRDHINALKFAIDNDLNLLPVKNRSDGVAFVVYKNDLESAKQLADFAAKKEGYLKDETPEEAEFIGQLLDYDPADIQEYINRKYYK